MPTSPDSRTRSRNSRAYTRERLASPVGDHPKMPQGIAGEGCLCVASQSHSTDCNWPYAACPAMLCLYWRSLLCRSSLPATPGATTSSAPFCSTLTLLMTSGWRITSTPTSTLRDLSWGSQNPYLPSCQVRFLYLPPREYPKSCPQDFVSTMGHRNYGSLKPVITI